MTEAATKTESVDPAFKHVQEAVGSVRKAIAELEAQKAALTSSIDDRIAKLRAVVSDMISSSNTQARKAPGLAKLPPYGEHTLTEPVPVVGPTGRTQRTAYDFLRQKPSASYRDLVGAFGEEYSEKSYTKARNAVMALKKQRWLDGGPGEWKVLQGPKRGEASAE